MNTTIIFCCFCNVDVDARLTSGKEIYPKRSDLSDLPFWICDKCGNFVGCHHKTADKTKPLGCIPTISIRNERVQIHYIIEKSIKDGLSTKPQFYKEMSARAGRNYHTAEIRTIEEAITMKAIARSVASYFKKQQRSEL